MSQCLLSYISSSLQNLVLDIGLAALLGVFEHVVSRPPLVFAIPRPVTLHNTSFFTEAKGPIQINGGEFYNIGGNMVGRNCDVRDSDPEMKGIVEGLRVLTTNDISLGGQIVKGKQYRLHSAQMLDSGRAVAVKVYNGQDAEQQCVEAAKYSRTKWHPNIPHVIAVSALNSEPTFLVFDDDYEGAVESVIAVALRNGLKQSLILGLQTVISLSSGLDYLQDLGFLFVSAQLDHFIVLLSRQGKIVISFNPDIPEETNEPGLRLAASKNADRGLDIFYGLCQRTFDAACKAHYKSQQIERADPEDPHQSQFEELDDPEQLLGGVVESGSTLPTSRKTRLHPESPTKGHRRELVWRSPVSETVPLEDISRDFRDFLTDLRSSSQPVLNRRRGRYAARTAHRCPGYNRIEITLTTDVERSAIVSHFTPTPHEICPVCREVVKDAEIFNCICGGSDDESVPTIRCSACSEWHHRPCVDVSENQPFKCQRCRVDVDKTATTTTLLANARGIHTLSTDASVTTNARELIPGNHHDDESTLVSPTGVVVGVQGAMKRMMVSNDKILPLERMAKALARLRRVQEKMSKLEHSLSSSASEKEGNHDGSARGSALRSSLEGLSWW